MQATDFTDWHDLPSLRRLDRPRVRRILAEGEMGSGAMVHEVASQDVAQVALAQDEDVVETLAPDRADDALRDGVLVGPGAAVRTFGICIPSHAGGTRRRNRIAIAEEIGGGGVVREGVDDLLGWRGESRRSVDTS